MGSFARRACCLSSLESWEARLGRGFPHLPPYEGQQPTGRFWVSNNLHLLLWVPGSSTVSKHSPDSKMGKPSLRENRGLGQFCMYWESSHTTWAKALFSKEWGSTVPVTCSLLWLRRGRVYRARWGSGSLRPPITLSGFHLQPVLRAFQAWSLHWWGGCGGGCHLGAQPRGKTVISYGCPTCPRGKLGSWPDPTEACPLCPLDLFFTDKGQD